MHTYEILFEGEFTTECNYKYEGIAKLEGFFALRVVDADNFLKASEIGKFMIESEISEINQYLLNNIESITVSEYRLVSKEEKTETISGFTFF